MIQTEKTLSDSQLAMWRSLIALAYADGTLDDNEKSMLLDYIKANHIVSAQHAILDMDIANGVKFGDVYPGVTNLHDRSNLINIANVLLHVDGAVSPAEQQLYDAIDNDQKKVVDYAKAETDAKAKVEDMEFKETGEEIAEEDKEGRVGRLIDHLAGVSRMFAN